jgi:hypothetical protein
VDVALEEMSEMVGSDVLREETELIAKNQKFMREQIK